MAASPRSWVPSGTGKTTLLRTSPDSCAPTPAPFARWPRRGRLSREQLYELREALAICSRTRALLTDFDVFENVAFPLREHTRLPEELMRDLVLMKLQAVGLRGAARADADRAVRRHGAARGAGARDRARPMLILYDEPFVGLDPIALNQVLTPDPHAQRHARHHQRPRRARIGRGRARSSITCYLIAGGKVVAQGTPADARATTNRRGRGSSSAARPMVRCRSSIRRATTRSELGFAGAGDMSARTAAGGSNVVTQSLAQIGACGLFLLTRAGSDAAQLPLLARDDRARFGSSAR